ncbi:GNAT family N-acetyltransferase [Bradyrhizobium sp. KB893862 SZCCT0404]|uniref:acyl-homoserine-lactone synthase n=1 Tax=Bradyrhizobium sp. KB893862 SZCCT0404 TaxID=2807672 RepID=UPI001BA7ACD6|nr:acyl-homoserine-lactone synthase [Bradyrhizobium sp. KB893862 SZCCT0404]MBR1177041.1 GNAT family N-acetyltransferase [Bradyrhizobium sp. KB893862 SZCCT0404]
MIQLITAANYGEFSETLVRMHQLRYRVFRQRLGWDVQVSGDLEADEFDSLHPAYLVMIARDGSVQGSVRLLPSTGPTMLGHIFPILLAGQSAPSSPSIWESSRFAVDIATDTPKGPHGIALATYELFAGMIEFGLSRSLTDIVTVTDARMERILRRAGWCLRRIAEPQKLGNTTAVAGYLEISTTALAQVRMAGGLPGPILWTPVISAAA